MGELKLKDHVGIIGLVALTAAFIAGGMWLVGQQAGKNAAKATIAVVRGQVAKGCDRNQLQRGYLQVRAIEDKQKRQRPVTRFAPAYFRIVNCEATYSKDRASTAPVYLAPAMSKCFVRNVEIGTWAPMDKEPTTDPKALVKLCRRSRGS